MTDERQEKPESPEIKAQERAPYEPPKVKSLKLSQEAAESLT